MKKSVKSMVVSILCFAIAFIVLIPTTAVKADQASNPFPFQSKVTLSISDACYIAILSKEQLDGRKITSVKSSRDGEEVGHGDDRVIFETPYDVKTQKYQTGKVTYTVMLSAAGKSDIQKKMTVKFIKYQIPLKKTSFLSSKDMSALKNTNHIFRTTTKQKETVKFKAMKNWKITSIEFEDTWYNTYGNTTVKVKNNTTFKYKGIGTFVVKVKNLETGFVETIRIETGINPNA